MRGGVIELIMQRTMDHIPDVTTTTDAVATFEEQDFLGVDHVLSYSDWDHTGEANDYRFESPFHNRTVRHKNPDGNAVGR